MPRLTSRSSPYVLPSLSATPLDHFPDSSSWNKDKLSFFLRQTTNSAQWMTESTRTRRTRRRRSPWPAWPLFHLTAKPIPTASSCEAPPHTNATIKSGSTVWTTAVYPVTSSRLLPSTTAARTTTYFPVHPLQITLLLTKCTAKAPIPPRLSISHCRNSLAAGAALGSLSLLSERPFIQGDRHASS